jgi:DNA-binding beta-propeller fold protein YncE
MKSLSVGRFPHGLALISLFLIGSVYGQPVPAAVVISPNTSTRPCAAATIAPATFPIIDLDCTHRLEYLGHYSADGQYSAISPHRRWYNQQVVAPNTFQRAGKPLTRPAEVPSFIDLHPQERIVQNYAPPAHAAQALRGQSRLAALRDHLVTFAYGREQSVLAPQHLTMDSKGRLIVTDPVAGAVHVLDGNSSFRIVAGDHRRLQKPNGIAVDADDNIYIVDSERGLVQVYDPRGSFLHYIGKIDDESLFDYPTGIAIDRKNGRMYLLDTPRNVLIILDLQGNILKKVGRRSSDAVPVEFRYPTEIAMGNGEVVVLDAAGSHIQVFDLDGKLLRQFNTYTSSDPGIPKLRVEMGLGADAEGNIYLSNFSDSGVRVFDRQGKILNSFGRRGPREGQFDCPSGVWVQDSSLFIADTENRRVEVFKINSLATELNKQLVASGK